MRAELLLPGLDAGDLSPAPPYGGSTAPEYWVRPARSGTRKGLFVQERLTAFREDRPILRRGSLAEAGGRSGQRRRVVAAHEVSSRWRTKIGGALPGSGATNKS